jgi:MOSC domain-containing protein YiiM
VTSLPTGTIIGLFVGQPERLWPGQPESAIAKRPVAGPLAADTNGFRADSQADRAVHGGPEKAIHHYAAEYHAYWRTQFPALAARFQPGGFGENVSTEGLTEDNLCLGDRVAMGSIVAELCQGRQPCWKLNAHIGLDVMAFHFRQSGRTGWYYRVLEPGEVRVGDRVAVIARPLPAWPLRRLIAARFAPAPDRDEARFLAACPALSASWRTHFAQKAEASS